MLFLELTAEHGPCLINLNEVVAVMPRVAHDGRRFTEVGLSDRFISVTETVEEVGERIQHALIWKP